MRDRERIVLLTSAGMASPRLPAKSGHARHGLQTACPLCQRQDGGSDSGVSRSPSKWVRIPLIASPIRARAPCAGGLDEG